MTRKFTLKSRTAAGEINFTTDLAINTQEDVEEDRRVFHVAVTRAKDELYLVVPQLYRNRSRSLVMMRPNNILEHV